MALFQGLISGYNPLSLSFILLLSIIFWGKLFRRGSKLNLPPSPPRLPIIGNLHQLGTLPHHTFHAFSRKYGPLMLLHLGQNPSLVVSSAEMAREITKTHDIVVSNRPRTTVAEIACHGCLDILFAPYGEYWRKAKKLCYVELLSHRKVQSTQFVRDEEVASMISEINWASCNGNSVNLSAMIMVVINNIISRCLFSRKAKEEDGNKKFGESLRNLKAVSRTVESFLDRFIEEHRLFKSKNNDNKDFLHTVLQLQEDNQLDMELTQDNLKTLVLVLLLGGIDATATTTEWVMAELLKNPNIMRKMQVEVREVTGNKTKIDASDINKMKYLKCVIKETLRLHPPFPFSAPRVASASVKVGGYDIPPKTKVFINIWTIQRDPKSWERPEEFYPERFENNPIDYRGGDHQFILFGSGRRVCPGILFGIASVEYLIANVFVLKVPLHAAPIPYCP
ncbi:hypothetical protein SLA2020_411870 [Shorea laevis]